MTKTIYCNNCKEPLAYVESALEIRMSEKGTMTVLGITPEGELSSQLTCLECGHCQDYYGVESGWKPTGKRRQ